MIALILSYLFLMIASACNAVMDKITHHYDNSIFKFFNNRYWWDPSISWENKYILGRPELGRVQWNILGFKFNKPVQITDAFHFFKMWMIIFICASIACNLYCNEFLEWYWFLVHFILLGISWNVTFSRFYEKILSRG